MEVRWTRRARRRLDQHTDYIAQHSANAANEILQRVRHNVDALADNPLLGREGRILGTRELVIPPGRYVVIYRVRGQVVQIASIHDTHRPWPATAADL